VSYGSETIITCLAIVIVSTVVTSVIGDAFYEAGLASAVPAAPVQITQSQPHISDFVKDCIFSDPCAFRSRYDVERDMISQRTGEAIDNYLSKP
jgi:hypothetical protein